MTNEDNQNFNNTTECYICELPFENQRITIEEGQSFLKIPVVFVVIILKI